MNVLPIATGLLGLATLVANAQLRPLRQQFPVARAAVAGTVVATLAARGIEISIEEVKLPLDVLANEENPLLEVSAVERLGRLSTSQPGQMSASVKLKCKLATACRPFFAIATWQQDQQATAAAEKAKEVAEVIVKPRAARPATVVKAGQPMVLVMDADHARIQIAVVSLANASLGQKLRVSTPDHKRFYMAEVLDAGTVKGSF